MKNQQSFTGTIGAGQTGLVGKLRRPKEPWAFLLGFLIGLATVSVVSIFLGAASVLVLLCVWFGAGFWIRRNYQDKLNVWQDYLDKHFICLRCGTIFQPSTIGGQESSQPTAELDQARNSRVG